MSLASLRSTLEDRQVSIYFLAVASSVVASAFFPQLAATDAYINPALALMLFATFLNVPLGELGAAFRQVRFMTALMIANFVAIPLLVAGLVQFLPNDPMLRIGVLLVLLTPCIDYVVTFAHLGKGDARSLLAATPLLLVVQVLTLPLYLQLLLAGDGKTLIQIEPFAHAFVWLIAMPLLAAALVQEVAKRRPALAPIRDGLGLLAVPLTALVLIVVMCAVVPRLDAARTSALLAAPVYVAFAVLAPLVGIGVGKLMKLPAAGTRALAFSSATRNSLVVLPIALAIPDAIPILPAVIVTQTLIELISELLYLRILPRVGADQLAG